VLVELKDRELVSNALVDVVELWVELMLVVVAPSLDPVLVLVGLDERELVSDTLVEVVEL